MPELLPRGLTILLKVGLRNLWRNPRRTLLVLASMLVGFSALTFIAALQDGLADDAKRNFILTLTGHVQVHAAGFEESQQIREHIADTSIVARTLAGLPSVAAWTPRVRTSGLASVAQASTGVRILGIDAGPERQVSRLHTFVVAGSWLPPEDAHAVLLGQTLAENLGVELGDKVILMAQGPSGDIAAEFFRLRGILHSGVTSVDRHLALVPLRTAQQMLELDSGVTDIVIRASEDRATPDICRHLRGLLPESSFEVLSWSDLNPMLQQRIAVADAFAYFLLFIVVAVVLVEILNTMLMALHERTHEFGLMEALGTRKSQIFFTVLWESVLLVTTGCLGGYLLGAVAVLYFSRVGIDISGFSEAFRYLYFNPVLRPMLTGHAAVRLIGTTLVAAAIASIYPAWKATRLHPVEAMRHI